jgi:hypothetical protein
MLMMIINVVADVNSAVCHLYTLLRLLYSHGQPSEQTIPVYPRTHDRMPMHEYSLVLILAPTLMCKRRMRSICSDMHLSRAVRLYRQGGSRMRCRMRWDQRPCSDDNTIEGIELTVAQYRLSRMYNRHQCLIYSGAIYCPTRVKFEYNNKMESLHRK